MKHRIVTTTNVARLREAGDLLLNRAPNTPGMGLIYGDTGLGKTTAATWYMNQCNAVLVRALAVWSPQAMLEAILRELNVEPRQWSCAKMAMAIVERLAETNRPLFIDEADYLLDRQRMTETLRDLHDLASVPVILIGMKGIEHKIGIRRRQLSGRLMRWVEFLPADMGDTKLLADGLCEVGISEDLLALLHQKTGGLVRHIVVGLAQIESHARRTGLATVSAKDWPSDRPFFVGGPDEPSRGRAPKAPPPSPPPPRSPVTDIGARR